MYPHPAGGSGRMLHHAAGARHACQGGCHEYLSPVRRHWPRHLRRVLESPAAYCLSRLSRFRHGENRRRRADLSPLPGQEDHSARKLRPLRQQCPLSRLPRQRHGLGNALPPPCGPRAETVLPFAAPARRRAGLGRAGLRRGVPLHGLTVSCGFPPEGAAPACRTPDGKTSRPRHENMTGRKGATPCRLRPCGGIFAAPKRT